MSQANSGFEGLAGGWRRLGLVAIGLAAWVSVWMAGPARADQFAYVTNMPAGGAIGGSVSQYRVGAGGLLSPLTPAAVNAGHSGGGIDGFYGAAVSPDGASVYVAGGLGRGVLQYDVGADGALSAKRPPSVAGIGAGAIAVNPSGASVYVSALEYDALLQYDVGADGALRPKTPPTAVADDALAIAVAPSGTSVYAAGQGGKDLMQYDVGADGALTPKNPPTVPSLDYVNHVVVSPDGTSAYATATGAFAEDSLQSPVVEQYDVSADGALTPKNPPSVAATGARAIAVSPDGTSVYVTGNDTVSQYNVGAGGTLTPHGPPNFSAPGATGVAVSPNGANVYITSNPGGAVYQYDVGPGGTLTPKTPSTVPGESRRYATAVALGPPFAVVASGRGVICRQRTTRTEVNCAITVAVKSAAVAATATLVRHGRTTVRLPATTGPQTVRVAVTPTVHVRPGSYTLSLALNDRHHRRSNLRRLVTLR